MRRCAPGHPKARRGGLARICCVLFFRVSATHAGGTVRSIRLSQQQGRADPFPEWWASGHCRLTTCAWLLRRKDVSCVARSQRLHSCSGAPRTRPDRPSPGHGSASPVVLSSSVPADEHVRDEHADSWLCRPASLQHPLAAQALQDRGDPLAGGSNVRGFTRGLSPHVFARAATTILCGTRRGEQLLDSDVVDVRMASTTSLSTECRKSEAWTRRRRTLAAASARLPTRVVGTRARTEKWWHAASRALCHSNGSFFAHTPFFTPQITRGCWANP